MEQHGPPTVMLLMETYDFARIGTRLDWLAQFRSSDLVRELDAFMGLFCSGPRPSSDKIAPIFTRRFDLTSDELSHLDEDIAPLVIVREVVARHKIVIDKKRYRNWSPFVDRYRAAIHA